MAAPLIRGAVNGSGALSITSPAGTQIGDLVILATFERLGAGAQTLSLRGGESWEQLALHFLDDGSTDGCTGVAAKIATAAGAQTYQAFNSSTGTPNVSTIMLVLQAGTFNTDLTSTTLKRGTPGGSTTSAAPNPLAVTGLDTTKDYLAVTMAAWHMSAAATNTITAPSTYVLRADVAGSDDLDVAFATKDLTDAGQASADPGAFADTVTPNGTSSFTFAVPEAPPAGEALAATPAGSAVVTAGLSERGPALASSTLGGAAVTGALSEKGPALAAAPAGAASLAADLTERVSLAASVAGAAAVSADVSGTEPAGESLAATIAGAGAVTAGLGVVDTLQAAPAGAAVVTANLVEKVALQAAPAGQAQVAAALAERLLLSGNVAGGASVIGDLTGTGEDVGGLLSRYLHLLGVGQ